MSENPVHQKKNFRQRGQIILMVGLATIVMFGIVGLAVDVGRLYVTRVELGRSLDAAALSGILELNGQSSGLTNAVDKANEYFNDNEPNATANTVACDGDPGPPCNGEENTLTMDGQKTIKMIFLSVLGIRTATVTAHAKAGFGTQFLDAVMVLDATPSMAGNPITQAKAAATSFKNILLGNSPTGNVMVGVTPFRGCFNPPRTQSDCITSSQIAMLTSNSSTLTTKISAITASGGGGSSATNVCTGLAEGYKIISGAGNHNDDVAYPGHREYMILLSDGDNAYWGNIAYQDPYDTTAPLNASSSPTGAEVGGLAYPCQPYNTQCGSPWGGSYCTTTLDGSTGAPNGTDGSNPATCVNQNPTKRERQIDVRTLQLARAIKAQGVEIFVVAFSGGTPGCNLGDTSIFNDEDPADCNTVNDLATTGLPNGPIGDGTYDDAGANSRLLKCISSNTEDTNDHYFYANTESELNGIFTAIANQIAHRLIE